MLRVTINGTTKDYADLYECQWDVENEIELSDDYIEDMINGCWGSVEVRGETFTTYEVLKNCAEWKIDLIKDEEKDYIVSEIMHEIENTEEGEIERYNNLVDIEVLVND